MDPKRAVEAALFSSAEGLRIQEISERTGIPEEEIRTAVMDLRREYDDRDSAIVISKAGNRFRMMLRSEYTDFTGKFAKARRRAQARGAGVRVGEEVRADVRADHHAQVLGVLRHRFHEEIRHPRVDRGAVQELPRPAGRVTPPPHNTYFSVTYITGERLRHPIDMVMPASMLERSLDRRVSLLLKDGRTLDGKLTGFDEYMNMVLEEAVESDADGNDGRRLGTAIIRGNNVVSITAL